MADTPDATDLLAEIELYLQKEAVRRRESWTEEDTVIIAALGAAITAARRKGYSEADLHSLLRLLFEL